MTPSGEEGCGTRAGGSDDYDDDGGDARARALGPAARVLRRATRGWRSPRRPAPVASNAERESSGCSFSPSSAIVGHSPLRFHPVLRMALLALPPPPSPLLIFFFLSFLFHLHYPMFSPHHLVTVNKLGRRERGVAENQERGSAEWSKHRVAARRRCGVEKERDREREGVKCVGRERRVREGIERERETRNTATRASAHGLLCPRRGGESSS